MAAKVRLPRKRIFSLKGNQVELAIGLLIVSILEARSADATVSRDGLTGNVAPALDAQPTPPTLEKMLGVAPDTIKTISLDELKAHLTGAVLASLGLDDKVIDLLDHDQAAAIQQLEDAYQQKLAQLEGDGGHIAAMDGDGSGSTDDGQGDDSGQSDDSSQGGDDGDDSGDQDAGFLGLGHDYLPLLILAGVGGIAAAGIIATNNDDDVNHSPTAANDAFSTNENSAVTFDVRTNDTDSDGDSLTVTQINGTAIDQTHPVTVTGGVISIGADGKLTFTPSANYFGTPSFTYTVSDGHGGTSTATVNLTVNHVNQAPVNTVPGSVSANAGSVVAVSGLSISDVDGGSGYTTTIKVGNGILSIIGTVTGGAAVAGIGTNTLVLTGTIDQINATLKALGYTSGSGFLGDTTLTITTSDGSLTDTDTVALHVTTALSGVAEDGLIAGATVYVNGVAVGTTGADGKFAIAGLTSNGIITVVGGTNVDTGLPNTLTLSAPMGSTVVNPLTTMLVGLMADGNSLADANHKLAMAFGLPDGTDFSHFDFLSADSDPALALAAQKVATEIATVMVLAGADGGDAAMASVLAHIVAAINAGGTVDLTNLATIHDLLEGSGLSDAQMNSIAAHAASINAAIAAATSSGDITDTVGSSYPGGTNPPVDGVLAVTQDNIADIAAHAADYAALGITTLDVVGDVLSLTDAQANALDGAGLHFADGDDVTVDTDGGTLATSLKGLERLGISTILVAGGSVTVEAGSGLGDIAVAGMPHFVGAGGALSVTLDVSAGTVDPTVDLSSLASALHGAGVSHISVAGGELVLTDAQATALVGGGVDITAASDVGLTATSDEVHSLVTDLSLHGLTSVLTEASVDHLDVVGDHITLSDAEAGALAGAGIDFAVGDDVTVSSGDGTHLSTSLKGLSDLHVDTVLVSGGSLVIDAGAGLGGISASGLPHFVGAAGDPSVTLNVTPGTVDPSTDLSSLATSLHGDGVDHIGVVGGGLTLTDAQATELVHGGLDITAASDVTLTASADEVHSLVSDLTLHGLTSVLHEASVDHIDVAGDNITLTDTEAGWLTDSGIDFATGDDVTVTTGDSTHLGTTLKGLANLHVDTVMVAGGSVVIDAGSGLGDISASGLPHFVGASGDPSVTLDVTPGTVDPSQDLSSLATSLHDAGIDHIGVVGGGLTLTDAQANELIHGGLDITAASDVGLTATSDEVHSLVTDLTLHGLTSVLHEASVDHIDVVGDNITLTDTEAGWLSGSGIDFATGDDVTVTSGGSTHLGTSLKGLADLHVDTILVNGSSLVIDAGASLATLSTEALPHIIASGGGDADVTLNVAAGTLDPSTDLSTIAHNLAAAGVDHIGVTGGGLTLSGDQALAFADAGINFAHDADITVDLTAAQLGQLAASPSEVYAFGVDHVHVTDGGPVDLTDADASALIAAGVDFVALDDVHVHAAGTHLSSTLSDLQSLHVDSVAVAAGVHDLHIEAGDLSTVTSTDLPQFDVDQSNASLNVTLHVDTTQLADLDRLGESLKDAGIDHFGLDQPLDSYDAATQAYMEQITHDTGISFVYDPQTSGVEDYTGFGQDTAVTSSDKGLVQSIITAFQELEDHGHGGQVVVQDDVIPALAESGALRAYTADTLVVDGSHSGDLLLTTLKDIADLGVDHVVVSNGAGPAYVDIGNLGDDATQVKALFDTLNQNVTGSKIFEGNAHVALVVDEAVAKALGQIDGSMEKLASLGFTEVDVLADTGSTTAPITSTAVEVKLIGQDDDLYKHLHHG